MFRSEMPRVYELQDLIADRSASNAYFQKFDTTLRGEPEKRKTWLARERTFQRLDQKAWTFLKKEAQPYLTKPDSKGRGYQQLISMLNQAWAYEYLIDIGCSGVAFIPSGVADGQETPDLAGELGERRALCEVKTLGISDDEVGRRNANAPGSTTAELEFGFLNKLNCALLKASSQMKSYDSSTDVKRIAFVAIDFDDFQGEYKEGYYAQIDGHLAANPVPGIDILFHNSRTAFHRPISMKYAKVINEPAG